MHRPLLILAAALALMGCASKPEPAAQAPAPTAKAEAPAKPAPEFDMKLYPGMKLVQDSLITTSTADGQSANANYTTSDPVEKVVQFYQKELGEAAKLEKTQENGATIAILILTEGSTVRTVTVSRNQGEEVTTVSLTKNVRSAPKG